MSVWLGLSLDSLSHTQCIFFFSLFQMSLTKPGCQIPLKKGDDSVDKPYLQLGRNSHHCLWDQQHDLITLQDRFCSWGNCKPQNHEACKSYVSLLSEMKTEKEPQEEGRWWPTGVNSNPQLMASKQTGAWDLQLQGTGCLPTGQRAGNDSSLTPPKRIQPAEAVIFYPLA